MSNDNNSFYPGPKPELENSMGDYSSSWITDYAWISGVSGAIATIGIAIWYNIAHTLNSGLKLFGFSLTSNTNDSVLAALLMITLVMVSVETIRIWNRDKSSFFTIHPKIKSGQHLDFIFECILNFIFYLGLIWLIKGLYHTAGEYGYIRNAGYYQVWFRFFDWAWYGFLYGGLPYVIITRALKYDLQSDSRDYGFYFKRLLNYPLNKFGARFLGTISSQNELGDIDKKITLGLLVKIFFTPLMTIFFIDQFPHLVSNIGYLANGLWDSIASGNYDNNKLNNDLYNISIAFIFSIDVALAWCGYVISSRWVNNQTISTEPTAFGWIVCLLCYPPGQQLLGLYYSPPGEKEAIYMFQEQWIITFFLIMMIASYVVYMSATLWFGTRFSNITHRGIIRKGPFSIVRHPAYASKNFAWWCIMFPAIVYSAINTYLLPAFLQFLGLIIMTTVYYWRAITEERHLSLDPAYREYCKHVKYRFIPGVL